MTQNISLSIAGFNLTLKFQKTENSFYQNILIRDVKQTLQSNITQSSPKKPDFTINFIDHPEVILEKNSMKIRRSFIYAYGEIKINEMITFNHISLQQLTFALIKILQFLLKKNGGFLIHSSANIISGKAVLFTGESGAGKSTIMTFLNRQYQAFSDDTLIIKKANGRYLCFQTPLVEKNAWVKKTNRGFPISRIYFLRKSDFFRTNAISDKNRLISNLSRQIWTDKGVLNEHMGHFLDFINGFDDFYRLYFAKDQNGVIKFFRDEHEKI